MSIVNSYIVPHPPVSIPEIAHGREKEVQATVDAYNDFDYLMPWKSRRVNGHWDGKDFVVKVDGNKVEPKNSFLSGDGEFVIWVNATSFTPGEHSLSVTADGLPDGNATFTVE